MERKSEELSYSGSNVTIDAGKGDDSISNSGNNVLLGGGAGNDTIENSGGYSYSRSDTGEEDDFSIYVSESYSGSNVTIDAGKGNDFIRNSGSNVTISGGAGNDHISLGAVGNLIEYASGDGKDTILGFNESDTLTISGGSYSTQASGSDVLVKVGKGSILLKDAKGKALNINDTKTTDIITLSDGADNLRNTLADVKIQALGGNDSVDNSASNIIINGGNGNDSISNSGSNVTIDGGKGNDTLSLGYTNNLIQYTSGDGNDLIQGFDEDDTLQIADSSYSTKKSGNNIIVTVGKGKITLSGAAGLETLNIVRPAWTLDGTTATYGTQDKTLVTVDGVKSLSGISLSGTTVTVKKASLGTSNVTISDGYTLKLGSDVTKPSTTKAWKLSKTTATYNQTTTKAGYTLSSDGKSISYSKAKATETLATVNGVKSTKGLSVSGEKITLKNSALNKKVTVSGGYEFDFAADYKNATITGSSNADTITARGSKILISGGNGNDSLKTLGDTTTLKGGNGDDTLTGGAGKDSLYGDNGNDSILGGDGNDTVSGGAGNDYLSGGNGYDSVFGGAGNDFLYGGEGNDVLYGNDGDDTLRGATGNDTLWGGVGADVFIHKPYDDISNIMDYSYDDGDILQILNKDNTNATYSKAEFADSKLTLSIGDGSVIFNNVSSGDAININGTKHTISGKTLK
ncbi:MAG: hypothetical protein SR3Q1_03510 [Quinella sp. 3Q1]|nr:hypothetical protein [Quinella sp. 3Q1]